MSVWHSQVFVAVFGLGGGVAFSDRTGPSEIEVLAFCVDLVGILLFWIPFFLDPLLLGGLLRFWEVQGLLEVPNFGGVQ